MTSYCVKEVKQAANPKARFNSSGFQVDHLSAFSFSCFIFLYLFLYLLLIDYQKYWALIFEGSIRFGRGELGEDCIIRWQVYIFDIHTEYI